MRKFVFALMMILGLSACGEESEVVADNGKPTVKIGLIYPMSGNMAILGNSGKIAMEIFFEKFNKKNRKFNYELIWEDSQMQPAKAVSAANKLIHYDKVDVLISFYSNMAMAIKPVATQNKVTHINLTSDKNVADNDYNFMKGYDNEVMASMMLEEIEKVGAKTISIVGINTTGMIDNIGKIKKSTKNTTISIDDIHMVNPGEKNFSMILQKIKKAKSDYIVVQMMAPEIDIFMRKYHENKIDIPVTSASCLIYLKNKNLANDMWYIDSTGAADYFEKKYFAKTGDSVTNYGESLYTVVNILTNTYETFDYKPTNDELNEKIRTTKEFVSEAEGKVYIYEKQHIFTVPVKKTIKNGKIELVKE